MKMLKIIISFRNVLNYFLFRFVHYALKIINFRLESANYYMNLIVRPRKTEKNHRPKYNTSLHDVGILIQGPLDNIEFVLETVRLYRRYYPNAVIIVSSWLEYKAKYKFKIVSAGAIPCFSKKPENYGQLNVNLQIVSTRIGLKIIKRLRCVYALKSRTDQRFYNPNTIEYLCWLITVFKPRYSELQLGRILIPGFNTTRYRYGSFSDMLQFGFIEDLTSYWSLHLDSSTGDLRERAKRAAVYTLEYSAKLEITESYIGRKYMKFLRLDNFPDLSAYWNCIRDCFIVFDHTTIDLYWHKYQCIENYISETPADRKDRLYEKIDFTEWLLLYEQKITFDDRHNERLKQII